MHTFNASSQSDIDAIVDQEWNIGRLGHSMEGFGDANLLGSIAGFVTQLDDCDAYEEGQVERTTTWLGLMDVFGPPSTAARTTSTISLLPRMAGVLSVTR
jgi:hypothetical protein